MITPPAEKSPQACAKVLVVDDVEANRIAFSAVLKRLGVEVHLAASGHEALAQILRHDYAVILLDVQMPELDGYETATLIRDHRSDNPVPIVFITAGERSDAREFRGYESGAIDYLFKPVDDLLLSAKVRVFVELWHHRAELESTSARLQLVNAQLNGLLLGAAEGIMGLDAHGKVQFVNPAGAQLLKHSPDELLNQSWMSLLAPEPQARFGTDFDGSELRRRADLEGSIRISESALLDQQGIEQPVQFSLSRVDGGPKQAPMYVLVYQDIRDRLRAQSQLREQAEQDELTGLYNRLGLQRRFRQLASNQRRSQGSLVLLYMDLDRFKPINDDYGHAAGDALLHELGRRMRQEMRSDDVLARLGGDEFVALIHGIDKHEQALRMAAKLENALRTPMHYQGHRLQVGASIGIAHFPVDGDDLEALLASADREMYEVKRERHSR